MVSDQELAKRVETVLRQSDTNAVTSLNGVVQQLQSELGFDLSHKSDFIRDQINLLLRLNPTAVQRPSDSFALHPQQLQFHPQFHPNYNNRAVNLNFVNPNQLQHAHAPVQTRPHAPVQVQPQPQPQQQQIVFKAETEVKSGPEQAMASDPPKVSAPTKKRGGPGGLNKVCGVTPELQVIVGEPALPRTEIVKQLWAYIREHKLQDPSNKRKIICDDALRAVFEIDCTDMFKMNKLLAKHIIRLEPTKESNRAKKLKVDVESPTVKAELGPQPVIISEALSHFFGTGERELLQSEVLKRIWEYIKVNKLEDPMNSMVILCDAKLQQLLGCESISALGISEMLARHHLFKQ